MAEHRHRMNIVVQATQMTPKYPLSWLIGRMAASFSIAPGVSL